MNLKHSVQSNKHFRWKGIVRTVLFFRSNQYGTLSRGIFIFVPRFGTRMLQFEVNSEIPYEYFVKQLFT